MGQGTGVPDRNLALRARFGNDKHADALATLHVALFRGDPGTSGVEPDATGGYARKAVTNDNALWGAIGSTAVSIANIIAVEFVASSGVYSITDPLDHWAVFDLSSGGVRWYWGPLSTLITVTGAGDQPRIPIGAWVITQPEA